MKIGVKSYSDVISLIYSIIFFILGAIIFTKPEVIILFISYVIGGIFAIIGLFKCIKNYLDIKKDNSISSKEVIAGILLIIIGLVFIIGVGLYTILESNLAFKTIGLVLMVYSFLEILGYILSKKDYLEKTIVIDDNKVIDTVLIEDKKKKLKKSK